MAQDLEQRIVELETRVAFQDQTLSELSDVLAALRQETAQQAERLRRSLDELKQARGAFYADPAEEPPPPHY